MTHSKNNSSENYSEPYYSSSNTQTSNRASDSNSQSIDDLSYMSVSVTANPKSLLDKLLDFILKHMC